MRFEDLRLSEPILRAVTAEGYVTPTPIQVKAIPHVLQGSDLLGCAQTGTGKTAAFALPILQKLTENQPENGPRHRSTLRALIICPTRELAAQIAESFQTYGRNLRLRHTVVYGGVSQVPQVRALKAGVDILIATPGRLLDLMNQGQIDLRLVETFVLDEADRMLDMGFIPDIRKIVKRLPQKRQTLMFSATMPADIRQLADSILNHPVSVQVNPVASTVQTITQSVYFVPRKNKPALLLHMLKNQGMSRTLVFTRTKHGADKVVKELVRAGIKAAAIHGNKSQNNRTRALASFKSDQPPVLVATDIASRGIDVDEITHVVNFDIPNVPETYVHRIGRTARAGAAGIAVSFCDPGEERGDLKAIERLISKQIEVRKDQPVYSAVPVNNGGGADDRPDRSHQRGSRGGDRSASQQRGRSQPRSSGHGSSQQSSAGQAVHHPKRDAAQPAMAAARPRGLQSRGRGSRQPNR